MTRIQTQRWLANSAATEALGAEVASWMQAAPGGVIYLEGELGAGKTTLMRGLLRSLGVSGPIRSPTYSLIEPYELKNIYVIHADLYRLGDATELYALGLEDFPPEITWWWVEWAQRGAGVLPPAYAAINLLNHEEGRLARIIQPHQLVNATASDIKNPSLSPD